MNPLAAELVSLTHQAELAALERVKRQQTMFARYFPDCQPLCRRESRRREDHVGHCRVLYPKPLAFFAAGAQHRERLMLAANRTGKTVAAAYEMACHLTGAYPTWWRGHEFDRPITAWAAGDTQLSTRDILQAVLMGPIGTVETREWDGMIPAHFIANVTRRSGGYPLCLDTIWVSHVSGGQSTLEFRSYDQGRRVFQGTARDLIWLDEEPPDPPVAAASSGEGNDIYTECLMRTLETEGLIIVTFTPLRGLTPFLQAYLESAVMTDSTGEVRPAGEAFWADKVSA